MPWRSAWAAPRPDGFVQRRRYGTHIGARVAQLVDELLAQVEAQPAGRTR